MLRDKLIPARLYGSFRSVQQCKYARPEEDLGRYRTFNHVSGLSNGGKIMKGDTRVKGSGYTTSPSPSPFFKGRIIKRRV